MDGNMMMFGIVGVVNVYLLFIMARIERTLESKVDAESLKEKFLLKDQILDTNIRTIHDKVNGLKRDVETFNASVGDLQEIVGKFSEEVLQIKNRLENFTAQMRATLDNALVKLYQHERQR